jgi:hypothetical protein
MTTTEIATANERRRIAQIQAHEQAASMPNLVAALVGTDISPDGAHRILDVAANDHAAALKAARKQRANAQAQHITQPGFGTPQSTEHGDGHTSGDWSKAVTRANRSVDDVTGKGEGQPSGWGAAVRNANRAAN